VPARDPDDVNTSGSGELHDGRGSRRHREKKLARLCEQYAAAIRGLGTDASPPPPAAL